MRGFSFNGKHCSGFGLMMKSKIRTLLPKIREQYEYIPGRHGSYNFSDGTQEDRIEEVECGFISKSTEDLRQRSRQIAAWLYTGKNKARLIFDDEPSLFYLGRLANQVDPEQLARMSKFTLQFRCDPFAYSEESQELYRVNENSFPFVVSNNGTAPTPPRIIVANLGTEEVSTIRFEIIQEVD